MSTERVDRSNANVGPLIAAIEAGGTKSDVMVGFAWDRPLVSRRVPTTDPDCTLGEISAFLDKCERDLGSIDAVGLATFGPVGVTPTRDNWGRIGKTPKVGWSGADVVTPFAANGRRLVAVETDVNAAAIAEARWGAARGRGDIAYITVGTGLGVGLLLDGRARHGLLHPEGGHIPLRRAAGDLFTGVCPFHGDCAEGLISGPAIKERLGRNLDMASATDDELALFVDYLGQLCATLILAVSIEQFVIGGGVMEELAVHDQIQDRMLHWLGNYLPVALSETALVVRPGLRGRSGIVGAFAIAQDAIASASS